MSKKSTENSDGKLQRSLSPMHVWAIAFGCVIGWGSFINPGKKFLPNSGVAGTAIAMMMVIMRIIRICGEILLHMQPASEIHISPKNLIKS